MCEVPSCGSSILPQKLFRFTDNYPNTQGYIEDTIMSILETWTLNDFAENQETLFNMMRVFLSGMNASPQALN